MKKNKLIIISILIIFIVGMSLSTASATKTISMKGYSVKLSDKEVKQLKNSDYNYILKSTGKKLKDKLGYEPIYQKKTIKKLIYKSKFNYLKYGDSKTYSIKKYLRNGWKKGKTTSKTIKKKNGWEYYYKYRYLTKKFKIGKKAIYKTGIVKIGIEKDGNKCRAILINDYPGHGNYRDMYIKRITL